MSYQLDGKHKNSKVEGLLLFLNNSSLKSYRRFALFIVAIASVITLNSCAIGPKTITLTSGSGGSGYQRIAEQISISVEQVNQIEVLDSYNSQGSQQNLQRLLNEEVDFAIVQLDVASEAIKQGKAQTLLILTEEYVHLITREDSGINTFADLKGKRVGVGAEGSGIYFTAKRLFQATNLDIEEVNSNFSDGLKQLGDREIDAIVYVGPLGTSKQVRTQLSQAEQLHFIPISSNLVNYLEIQFPESYRSAKIPVGAYKALPELPDRNIATISTPGALITRPDVSQEKVALLTWSILATFRRYYPFYHKLAQQNDRSIMYEGLIYAHAGALKVFENGDPRDAWLRYLQQNQPLQSGLIMLIGTSSIGFFLKWSRKKRSENLIKANRQAIAELRSTLDTSPQQALLNVEGLRQKYRLMLIDGIISIEVFEQIERMTEVFSQQCRTLQQKQNRESMEKIIAAIDQLQETLQTNPESSQAKLQEINQQYKDMLLSTQIDMNTYIQLEQLNSILMTYSKKPSNLTNHT